jgi:serine/threonine protein kinase
VNILVDNQGRAQLCDFGLAIVGSTTTGNMSATDTGAGTLRFMSPERFANEESRRTMSDDIYAFACLCYTVRAHILFQASILLMTP